MKAQHCVWFIAAADVWLIIFSGCPPPQPSHPDADGAPAPILEDGADACYRACVNLAAIGCPEGNRQCVSTCTRALAEHLTPLHTECLAAARTKEEARACSSVNCP